MGTQGSGSWWFVLLLFALLTDFGLVKYVWFCVRKGVYAVVGSEDLLCVKVVYTSGWYIPQKIVI